MLALAGPTMVVDIHAETTSPFASTILLFLLRSAQNWFVWQTSGPYFRRVPGIGFGLRHVTASGLPSPLGFATSSLSMTVLPSAARSFPCVVSCHHSQLYPQRIGPISLLPANCWGARQTMELGSPFPLGVSGITMASAGTVTGAATALKGSKANKAPTTAYRIADPSGRAR